MRSFRTQVRAGGSKPSEDRWAEPSPFTHYLYDSAGQRVKKLTRNKGGQFETITYIGATFEAHRFRDGKQGTTVHVLDGDRRIVSRRLGNAHPADRSPEVKYQLDDHLGSSVLVVDQGGNWVNREEYSPYGETTFGGFGKKRYRFTGKERDEESGLYYHGARYYAPWLGRWASCDPAGVGGGAQPYSYAFSNPLYFRDPDGNFPAPYEMADAWQRSGAAPVPGLTGETISQTVSDLGERLGGAIVDALPTDHLGGVLAATVVKSIFDVAGGIAAATVDPGMAVRGVMRFGTGTAQGVNDIEAGNTVLGASRIIAEVAQGVGMAAGGVATARAFTVPGTYQPKGSYQSSSSQRPNPIAQATEAEIDAAVSTVAPPDVFVTAPAPKGGRVNVSNNKMVHELTVPTKTTVPGATGDVNTRIRVHSPDVSAPPGSNSATGKTVSITQGGRRLTPGPTPEGTWHQTSTASGAVMNESHIPIHSN